MTPDPNPINRGLNMQFSKNVWIIISTMNHKNTFAGVRGQNKNEAWWWLHAQLLTLLQEAWSGKDNVLPDADEVTAKQYVFVLQNTKCCLVLQRHVKATLRVAGAAWDDAWVHSQEVRDVQLEDISECTLKCAMTISLASTSATVETFSTN